MTLSRRSSITLRVAVVLGLGFLYVPLLVIAANAFNPGTILTWPPNSFTLDNFSDAIKNEGARDALWLSVKAGLLATAIALVLGTLASMAVARHRFFGRDAISFVVVLPIALPGIVTAIALNGTFTQFLGINLGLLTIVIAHATFCIVVVFNNVVARLRRFSASFEEASSDLGADSWQTFRYVTFPNLRTAMVAGGLLAFALSFDEIIVTTFTIGAGQQTLPIWIFSNLFRARAVPVVNVVALLSVVLSMVPVYLAHRLTRDKGPSSPGAGGA